MKGCRGSSMAIDSDAVTCRCHRYNQPLPNGSDTNTPECLMAEMASVNGRHSTWSVPGPETRCEGVVGRVWSWIARHPWPCRHRQRTRVSIASSFSTGPRREGRVPPLSTISPWPSDCPPVRFLTRPPPGATVPPSLPQIPPLDLCRAQASVLPASVRSFLLSHSRRLLQIDPRSKFDKIFAHTLLRKEPHSLLFPTSIKVDDCKPDFQHCDHQRPA